MGRRDLGDTRREHSGEGTKIIGVLDWSGTPLLLFAIMVYLLFL